MTHLSTTPAEKPATRKRTAVKPRAKLPKAAPKKRLKTSELLENLGKFDWNFEAMKRA